jgi:hypothetical protein
MGRGENVINYKGLDTREGDYGKGYHVKNIKFWVRGERRKSQSTINKLKISLISTINALSLSN